MARRPLYARPQPRPLPLRLIRWLGKGAVWLLLVLAAALGGGYLWLRTGLPTLEGQVALPGLSAETRVIRDADGVPHIFAATRRDALSALGYVHAQDRLFQMEMMRRLGRGRLSEAIGQPGLDGDRLMRTLGIAARAEQDFAALDDETRAELLAYAQGVNAFIAAEGADWSSAWPPEFYLLGQGPEPWTPADSLIWGKLMAMSLSGNWRDEAVRARLTAQFPAERTADLFDDSAAPTAVTLRPDIAAALDPILKTLLAHLPEAAQPRTASNVWALDGSRTDTGKPRLASDPHLQLTLPSLWYLARLVTPEGEIAGATAPGVPFHLIGQNGRIAWGLTTTGADTQDLIVERLTPDRPGHYDTPAGPKPFQTRVETIPVRGGPPVELTVRDSDSGPILSDAVASLAPLATPGYVVALQATFLQPGDTSPRALRRIQTAANWTEFHSALRDYVAPIQNFTMAAADGTIGLIAAGAIPMRRSGDGTLPVPGWTGQGTWLGYIPHEALPQTVSPRTGQIANANNRLVGPDYPHLITREWDAPYRGERLEHLLRAAPRSTQADSVAMQMDIASGMASELLPLLSPDLAADDRQRDAIAWLQAWDGQMDGERGEPLLFAAWLRALQRAVFSDELGDVASGGWTPSYPALIRILSGDRIWCDRTETKDRAETCQDMMRQALDDALTALTAEYGADRSAWRWGEAHKARHAHPVFSRIPVLSTLFDRSIANQGGWDTLNRGAYRAQDRTGSLTRFDHVHGAGMRAVFELGDPGRSLFIISTGQSGHPFSPHFDDLIRRWRDGLMRSLSGSAESLLASGGHLLILSPPSPGTTR